MQPIQCNGKCGRMKEPALFRPSDLRREKPICRACRKQSGPTPSRRPGRGAEIWRQGNRRLFVQSLAEGRSE